MTFKNLRLMLKAITDETRFRIIHLLSNGEFTVKEIGLILDLKQPTVSRHLGRLRLLKIVNDRRKGNLVFYSLILNTEEGQLIEFLISKFKDIEIFSKDKEELGKRRLGDTIGASPVN